MLTVQIRGRHRGLPYALDKAIMLPTRTTPDDVDPPRHPSRRFSLASSTGFDRGRREE